MIYEYLRNCRLLSDTGFQNCYMNESFFVHFFILYIIINKVYIYVVFEHHFVTISFFYLQIYIQTNPCRLIKNTVFL